MTLTHRVDGHGPPLVLLNGGFMTIASWEPLAKPLSSSYRVIRCDFRGQLLTPMLLAARAPGSVDRLTVTTATERATEEMPRTAYEARHLAEDAAAGSREASAPSPRTDQRVRPRKSLMSAASTGAPTAYVRV